MTADSTLSEVVVANMAATTLEEAHITSFDDEDSSLAEFMKANFGPARDEVLVSYPWAFAETEALLPEMADKPIFGWCRQYQLPADYMRTVYLNCGGCWNGRPIPHERRGRRILCDELAPLPLVYVKRLTDIAQWDPLPARVLAEYLAVMAAQRITGKVQYLTKAQAFYDNAVKAATHVDSLTRGTPESQNRNDIHDVRLGGGWGSWQSMRTAG